MISFRSYVIHIRCKSGRLLCGKSTAKQISVDPSNNWNRLCRVTCAICLVRVARKLHKLCLSDREWSRLFRPSHSLPVCIYSVSNIDNTVEVRPGMAVEHYLAAFENRAFNKHQQWRSKQGWHDPYNARAWTREEEEGKDKGQRSILLHTQVGAYRGIVFAAPLKEQKV